MPNARILIVDDEPSSREALAEMLARWGHDVVEASDGHEALKRAMEDPPDVLVTDLVMPTMDGLFLLRAMKEEQPNAPVVLLTGQGSIDRAVAAIREGAYDFLEKPVNPQRLRTTIERALEKRATAQEMEWLRRSLEQNRGKGGFIGQSPEMKNVYALIRRVASAKASVVITGESGTGKEMVARAIHEFSPRADKPFIAVNCSAIPASLMESEIFGHERGAFTGADQRRLGCFELAHGGTLFLDELGELPIELQAKLLRVLEESRLRRIGGKSEIQVDVRVLCATNRDLKELIKANQFREDLYFRLNVFHMELPPLKSRREDIPLLAQHFIEKFGSEGGKRIKGITPEALEVLQSYSWPGNIRELRNTIERAVILADGEWIERAHLPPEMVGGPAEGRLMKMALCMPLREVEKEYILRSLRQNGGNKARTAELLGISEKTLYNKLNRYAEAAGKRSAAPDPSLLGLGPDPLVEIGD